MAYFLRKGKHNEGPEKQRPVKTDQFCSVSLVRYYDCTTGRSYTGLRHDDTTVSRVILVTETMGKDVS